VLLTGAGGQLGRALRLSAPAGIVLRALSHAELDIADAEALERAFCEFGPQAVINAAAFTGVDAAEAAPDEAARANATGPERLAAACAHHDAWLTHVSTDYVFDGRQGHPYASDAQPNPLSVYGRTKLEGERAVQRALPHQSTVVRASWLYSATGGFLGRMLALMRTRSELSVVSDQVSSPTASSGLAAVLWTLSSRRVPGVWHWCDSGAASWYDFAVAIAEEALRLKLLPQPPAILAIHSAQYPTAAARPPYSLLDKRPTETLLGTRARHWRTALRETLGSLDSVASPGARLPGSAGGSA
jgi:dTDP-4-dehydrorhamnose reductase